MILKYNSDNCGVYIYNYDSLLTIKLNFLFLLDITAQTKYNWCRYIFTKLNKSHVISFNMTNKSIEINIDLDKLTIIANSSNLLWINIFKILIRGSIYDDIQLENISIYPIQLITTKKWLINSNNYISVSTKK